MDLLRSASCTKGASRPASLQQASTSARVAPTPTSKVSPAVRTCVSGRYDCVQLLEVDQDEGLLHGAAQDVRVYELGPVREAHRDAELVACGEQARKRVRVFGQQERHGHLVLREVKVEDREPVLDPVSRLEAFLESPQALHLYRVLVVEAVHLAAQVERQAHAPDHARDL